MLIDEQPQAGPNPEIPNSNGEVFTEANKVKEGGDLLPSRLATSAAGEAFTEANEVQEETDALLSRLATGAPGARGANGGGAFAQASALGRAAAGGNGARVAEQIYMWEHGVAVEPWPEPVDGKALLDELARVIQRFVVLPRCAAEALALWVVHTYAFELRNVSSYIGIESPEKRCGKTTLLMVLCELANRPIVASNISSPAFFRVIEDTKPTLMIDEADTVLHRNKELQGILNSGVTRRTAYVIRVSTERESGKRRRSDKEIVEEWECGRQEGRKQKLGRYSSYCPKAIATIGRLPDTLEDRCIIVQMQRKKKHEKCERLRKLNGTELRRKCARFVLDRSAAIQEAQPPLPDELNDRAADVWEPLLAVADLAGGDCGEKARKAALGLSAGSPDVAPQSFLLSDVVRFFVKRGWSPGSTDKEAGRAFSREVALALSEMKERPWLALLGRRQMTELWLAFQLRPYGVRPRCLRVANDVGKGYVAQECWEALGRYVPGEEPDEEEKAPGNEESVDAGSEAELEPDKQDEAGDEKPGVDGVNGEAKAETGGLLQGATKGAETAAELTDAVALDTQNGGEEPPKEEQKGPTGSGMSAADKKRLKLRCKRRHRKRWR